MTEDERKDFLIKEDQRITSGKLKKQQAEQKLLKAADDGLRICIDLNFNLNDCNNNNKKAQKKIERVL
eukprot:UN22144